MKYRQMIRRAVADGAATDKAMLDSVDDFEELLEYVEENAPSKYERFLRRSYRHIYGPHYNKEFADHDVSRLKYTDKDGTEHEGAHWTLDETTGATKGLRFEDDVTEYDKYVALNAAYADFCREFDDAQVIRLAYLFFFDDEDWEGDGKVWEYMTLAEE